eukprot:scaffold70984_cov36-Cyclotella_meneghiniana.AAC.1
MHAGSSSDMSDLETSPQVASQWTQMRQEIVESLRAEIQNENNGLHSRVGQLENENSQLKSKVASLEEKVKSLENFVTKDERKAKYLEIVKKNKQWKYPLAVPTMSELMSDGYYEGNSGEIIRQIDDMKNVTTQMRKGKAIDYFNLFYPPLDPHLYYEGILLHYRHFADALMEYKHTINYMEDKAFRLVVGGTTLPAQFLLLLEKALKHTHFHQLRFDPILQIEGVRYLDFILNCVRENTRLEEFCLCDVTIGDVIIEHSRDIALLCEVLNNKASLLRIELKYCGTEGGVFREIFNKLRTEKVYKIDLTNNQLSNLRPTDMSEFLSSNPSLRDLILDDNPFNEQDIVYIADALKHNTTLNLLGIQLWDPPTNWHVLEYAIFDPTSLNAAYNSNHRCRLYNMGVKPNICRFNTCDDSTLNKRKKIFTLLSKRNRRRENASFFERDGIGIKHIPRILSLLKPFSDHHLHDEKGIQGDDEVKPLSIIYEIMRDWRMPELYNLD